MSVGLELWCRSHSDFVARCKRDASKQGGDTKGEEKGKGNDGRRGAIREKRRDR